MGAVAEQRGAGRLQISILTEIFFFPLIQQH